MSRRELIQLQIQALAAIILLAAAVIVHPSKAQGVDGLRIADAYVRSSGSAAQAAAAFMTVQNTGNAADRLIAASAAAIAGTVELHTVVKDGDVMRMRAVPAIDVPAGQTVTLRPGGFHVMLMGLRRPLAPGESIELNLEFEKAGRRTISVPVRALSPGDSPAHKH